MTTVDDQDKVNKIRQQMTEDNWNPSRSNFRVLVADQQAYQEKHEFAITVQQIESNRFLKGKEDSNSGTSMQEGNVQTL